MTEKEVLPFDFEKASVKQIIKVIGVGGGGGNAVKNMFREGIHDVAFALCNTDLQALVKSEIPTKVQLGRTGLGAGNNPEVATAAAEESVDQIRQLFSDDTKMVFITAGMGGGTGTGASPVIAREAQAAGMLTVGVVTIPFRFEQKPKIRQALRGVDAIAAHVDALLVINNERLFEVYPDMEVNQGFAKVNEILTVAVKSIAELITVHGTINLDFRDVEKVLKNGGVAVMSYGLGKGDHRLTLAINEALHSPLLNDNDVYNSKKILFNIYQSKSHPLLMQEMEELDQFMDEFQNKDIEVIWGIADDDSLDEEVKITVLATGFGLSDIPQIDDSFRHRERRAEPAATPLPGGQDAPLHQDSSSDAPAQTVGNTPGEAGTGQKAKDTPAEETTAPAQTADVTSPDDRITKIYGENFRSFIFSDADLCNDALISAIAVMPTYNRTGQQLKELQDLCTKENPAG